MQGFFCHCTRCQKSYGGLFQAFLMFAGKELRYTSGKPKFFESTKFARRGFCAECGSPIVFLYEGNPHAWILLGSLYRPEDWPMTVGARWGSSKHVYVETKIAWHEIRDGLPQQAGDDPGAIAAQQLVER